MPDPNQRSDVPIGPAPPDRIDDGLHFGWSWHRYRYCYRRNDDIKILDFGGPGGPSTIGLTRLNPGSTVVGVVDPSRGSIGEAKARAEASGIGGIELREQDPGDPVAGGPFDFIVAHDVFEPPDDPGRKLRAIARILDRRGLLQANFTGRWGRQTGRLLARALDAIVPADSPGSERSQVGAQLVSALNPDHPIRREFDRRSGGEPPTADRIASFDDGADDWGFDLKSAVSAIEGAGFRFLYASSPRPWRPDLVFVGPLLADDFKARVNALSDRDQALLIDALDPTLHGESYRIYACPADFEPRLPTWAESRPTPANLFDRLIPHPSGLARPVGPGPPGARVTYRAVSGASGDLDARTDAALRLADGRSTISSIEERFPPEPTGARQDRWRGLADLGFVLLEDPDPRQHVDCVHLGPVLDRLDCPCPRAWVRSCERHGVCTIDDIRPPDPRASALIRAGERLGRGPGVSCERCPDYTPDE